MRRSPICQRARRARRENRTADGLGNHQEWRTAIARAENEFDIFVTVDRNLAFQQNLPNFNIAVAVLHAPSNRLADLKPLAPKLLSMLSSLKKGEAATISLE